MRFEETVKSIWGKPQIPTTFAGYYDGNAGSGIAFKALLLSLCIYEINYGRDKYDAESLQTLENYQSTASKGDSTHSEDVKMIMFLHDHNSKV